MAYHHVLLDKRAAKEIRKFPQKVQLKIQALLEILEQNGKLEEPFGKKLVGYECLFEMRVKCNGEWRASYAYILSEKIIILTAFHKKSNKTPLQEVEKAKQRLREYIMGGI